MGMSRLRKANWLAQGFTAKEWLNLKDDPRSPASQAGVHPRDDMPLQKAGPCDPALHDPPDSLPAPQSRLHHLLVLGWAVLQHVLWALPAPGERFPGSCGRASFAWSSGSSWPAFRLMFSFFPLMTLDSLKALVSSSSCGSLLLSL